MRLWKMTVDRRDARTIWQLVCLPFALVDIALAVVLFVVFAPLTLLFWMTGSSLR
jgi:hypothetical protein